ncbi:MAG: xanthine phosphoribosyltransferase [Actinomycetes bacterium]|jgi:xanthine phosphoribosyltransferase|nr:xanthine phosphoribosyltransferase [Actinomycetes bacterium]
MQSLRERIVADGVTVGTDTVKVDSFLNHQIDVRFFEELARGFSMRFADLEPGSVDKILTVESSGIAVATFTAREFGYPPVVFAKKDLPSTMTEDYWFTEIMSFTKSKMTAIRIAKKYLQAGERVLIIDDFLAHGQAASGLVRLCAEAGCELLGVGAVIEKQFQGGATLLAREGVRVESLAVIERIEDGRIHFAEGRA